MVNYSLSAIIWTHFFIGIVIGVALWLIAEYRHHPRWFQFEGDVLTLGLPTRWLAWTIFCFGFEFFSACKAPDMYQEMALSLIEAPVMVVGVFIVDRIARWREMEQEILDSHRAAKKEREWNRREHYDDHVPPDDTDEKARRHFDDLTKGH